MATYTAVVRARAIPDNLQRICPESYLLAELTLMVHEERLLVERFIETAQTSDRVRRVEQFLRGLYPLSLVSVEMRID